MTATTIALSIIILLLILIIILLAKISDQLHYLPEQSRTLAFDVVDWLDNRIYARLYDIEEELIDINKAIRKDSTYRRERWDDD